MTPVNAAPRPTPWWRSDAALYALVAALFAVLNKPAFKAWFHDDDFENFNLSHYVPLETMVRMLFSWEFHQGNYRPVGEFWYRWTFDLWGLHYPAWIACLWSFHLVTLALLWLFLRRAGVSSPAACAAGLVFAVHAMTFPAQWQPMFVFDALCGLFTVLTLVLWQARRPVLAFAAYWLAYRSKEPAVMLPAVLLLYEWTLGERRWRWTLPYCAASLSFLVQGYFAANSLVESGYTLRLDPWSVWQCVRWYGNRMLAVPLGGFVLLGVALWRRTPLLLFGTLSAWLLLGPLLALPGRRLPVFLYTATLGTATAVAALVQWQPRAAALLLLWLPWNYAQMRELRNPILALGFEYPRYFGGILQQLSGRHPSPSVVVFDGAPQGSQLHGPLGMIRFAVGTPGLQVWRMTDRAAIAALQQPDAYLLRWDAASRQLTTMHRSSIRRSVEYLNLSDPRSVFVLDRGWFPQEAGCAWTRSEAQVSLHQPAGASTLHLRYNVGPGQERFHQRTELLLNGQPLLAAALNAAGMHEQSIAVTTPTARPVAITIRTTPDYLPDNGDERRLGLQVCAVGFRPGEHRP